MFKTIKRYLDKIFNNEADPVKKFPPKVIEHLLSFLKGEDLLRCSRINKGWYSAIAKSPSAMKKLRVCICEPHSGLVWKFSNDDANIMIKGGRQYQHLSLFITRNMTKDHLLLFASFKWKTLILYHHTFKSEIELINFIGLVEPTVEHLELRGIKIVFTKQGQISGTNFLFPNLKVLKIFNCYTFLHTEVFKNVDKVERLEIETGTTPVFDKNRDVNERVEAIKLMLVKNDQVKYLKLFLTQKDFNCMFLDVHFVAHIRFQLASLRLRKFRKLIDHESNEEQVKNFLIFLLSQKKSLTSLHLFEWMGNQVLQAIINEMDKLVELTLEDLDCYGKPGDSIAIMNLYNNESIESLTMFAKQSKFNILQMKLLETVPNLKHLNVGTVNQLMLNKIIEDTPKLESLSMDFFTAYIVPERPIYVLTDLKVMKFRNCYASNFKSRLSDHNESSNFERVFLKACKQLRYNYR